MEKTYCPCNPNAQKGVYNVLRYLSEITYKQVITGQHTQTMSMEEFYHIEKITGKKPALLGFELLSYSPNINYFDTDEACMTEVIENYGTLKKAWEWAAEKGLITFTWHWFSPLGGRAKSFYAEHTDYDPEKAVIEGTAEYEAMLSDLDVMAGILRPFCEKEIPILWRPFHEAEGTWFWWGSKGGDAAKKLYRIMYERFTNKHQLNNLIWVWNAPKPDFYPGDDVVDVISRDLYPPEHCHTSQKDMYDELIQITQTPKPVILAETGTLPDLQAIIQEEAGWASYMIWSKDFCLEEKFNTFEVLKKTYNSPYAVTKDKLPVLY